MSQDIRPINLDHGGRPPQLQNIDYAPALSSHSAIGGDDDRVVDFKQYFFAILKHRKLIIALCLVFCAIAFVVTNMMTPIYQATATLQIGGEKRTVVEIGDVESQSNSRDYIQTQYELLKSRSLAERIVANLRLADDKAFLSEMPPSFFSWVRSKIPWFEKAKEEPSPQNDTLERRTRAAIGLVMRNLEVNPVRGSLLVRLTYAHPNAEVAQRVANGIAENFISDNLNRRYEASSYARQFLEERLNQLRARMAESETELVAYARQQGIFGVDQQRTLTDDNLTAINQALNAARKETLRLEQLWKIAETPEGIALPEISGSKPLQEIRSRYMVVSSEYNQKLKIYKPNYPDMIVLRANMDELQKQIDELINAGRETIRRQYEAARNNQDALAAQLETIKAETSAMRDRGIQYGFLQREVDTNRTLYDGLLQRYKEIGIAGGIGTNNISFVDRAQLPGSPSSPKLMLNLAAALAAGLMIGIMAALLLEYIDDTIKAPEDLESSLHMPVVGMIPRPKGDSSLEESLEDSWSAVSEAYRSLRTTIQFSTPQGPPRSLLVTSPRPGDGKSTTALVIARNFAQLGQRVLLIDADLRYPSLHKKLDLNGEFGLSDYLSGRKSEQDIVIEVAPNNLNVILAGSLPSNPTELLSGPRMLSLLGLAHEKYDLVVIDSPPVMGLADAPLLASLVEATFLVVAAGQTRRDVARVAVKNLRYGRARLLGAVLTKFDITNVTYGYGYGYGYGGQTYHAYGKHVLADTSEAAGEKS